MNASQKRWVEIPFLILFIWLFQAIQVWFLQFPFGAGSVEITSLIAVYIAITRSWKRVAIFTFILGMMGSFTAGSPGGVYTASLMWTCFFAKVMASELSFEGRSSFALLVLAAHAFRKLVVFGILSWSERFVPMASFVAGITIVGAASFVFAYFFYPIALRWDEFFEHAHIESNKFESERLGSVK